MINRSAVMVRLKRPFLDWLKSLPDPIDLTPISSELPEERTIFLLPTYEMEEEKERLLKQYYKQIFEETLAEWWTDEADWPKNRTFNMLKEWLDVEFHCMILDLVDEPLLDEDRER